MARKRCVPRETAADLMFFVFVLGTSAYFREHRRFTQPDAGGSKM